MSCPPSGLSPESLSVLVVQTDVSRTVRVTVETFDTYADPCTTLFPLVQDRVLDEASIPPSAALVCSLLSYTVLSSSLRNYVFDVIATWTE